MDTIGHWIGGATTLGDAERRGVVWNPATGVHQASVVLGTQADVDAAVAAARQAAQDWAESSLAVRTRILFAFRELLVANTNELAGIVADEHGKAVADAAGEIQRGLEVVELACGVSELLKGQYSDQVSRDVDVWSYRQPVGIAAGITPFNFPVMVPMWMYPLAIACGNTFVLKPSERDPSASLFVARLLQQAGLPDGVFNVVQGDETVAQALVDHPDVAAVSFVGSTPIARAIYDRATARHKRVQALGGAKNHAVVLPTADLAMAADQLSAAAFGSAGQRCMAISAAVAVGGVHDALVEAVCDRARAVVVGSGRAPGTEMGPLVTPAAKERVERAIQGAQDAGARVALDGRGFTVPGYEQGFFVGPSVVGEVRPDMAVYQEEIFGPVLSVLAADGVAQAIELVNANPYGNGTAVFTTSGETARRFHRQVHVGMVGINVPIPVPVANYSFGGWKDSLFGDRHIYGPEGVGFYTRGKVVTARWPETRATASLHFPSS